MAKKTGTVNLYGEISSWNENNSIDFIKRLKEAAQGSNSVTVNIHCIGGEVFEGNMICNAISALDVPVDANIEGLCASMASIIITRCRSVSMAENAHIMIHAPASFVFGNATQHEKAAKLLRSIEKSSANDLVKRTGKTKEEVSKWFDGDNWFDAQEALDNGIIDTIIPSGGDSRFEDIIPAQDLKTTDYNTLYKAYRAVAQKQIEPKQITNQKEKEMDKESLIKRFGLTGVTAQSSDADIEAAIEAKMKTDRDQLAAMKKQQIEDVVTAAIAEKKITEAQKATYQGIGETSGIDALKAVFAGMKAPEAAPAQTITGAIKNVGKAGGATDRADWDWDKWQKDDPRGLEKMKTENTEAFTALYDAKYKS